ncbi:MAG: redoxin domain-containing protein [Fuerstiella sp.]
MNIPFQTEGAELRFCDAVCQQDSPVTDGSKKSFFQCLSAHLSQIAFAPFSLALIFVLASSTFVEAAESEFPKEWYFSSMEKMRASLEGGPAVELSTDTWIGDETSLEQCQGKVVVLDFWATWCGPCIASIPKNIAMVNEFEDDLVFLGVHSSTSGWDEADAMVADRNINYPVVLDTGDTAKAYGVTGFPTYVVIDRAGIVRAAGVQPSHVKKIVEKLINESGSGSRGNQMAGFNSDWFYGGASRMTTWQEQLGQTAQPVRAKAWWAPGDPEDSQASDSSVAAEDSAAPETSVADTADEPAEPQGTEPQGTEPSVAAKVEIAAAADQATETEVIPPIGQDEADIEGVVRVLHFTRPGMTVTKKQLKQLNKMAAQYASQGVVFTVVCDSESDWKATKAFATDNQLIIPMALDVAAKTSTDTKTPAVKAREAGQTAQSYHVRVAPVTVVVDRGGSIRATGLKLELLSKALELLLSEQAG